MPLSEHSDTCSTHSVRTPNDPSLISSSHRIPLLSLADDADVSDQLRSTLTGLARRLDQGIGCSPKQARGEADAGDTTSGPTEAP